MTSRLPGFYQESIARRLALVAPRLSPESRLHLEDGGALPVAVADTMSENVISCHGLPLAVALNFRVNGHDVLVPMAIEEPSVVAAASNAARLVRPSGGFVGDADPGLMTAQIQLDDVPAAATVPARLEPLHAELRALGDAAIPSMVARGGGCRAIDTRVVDSELGLVVVHIHVDVGDAMGANMVDAVAEAVAPRIAQVLGGRVGLRILTNLTVRRRVRVSAEVSAEALGGPAAADAIARASRFAERDPFRAVTHNKGIMNGIDAVAVALGQDWRAIEAGAHAWAALGQRAEVGGADGEAVPPRSSTGYAPLATWTRTATGLCGQIELPMAIGTVGGSTRVHAGVRAAFELVGTRSARELAVIVASAGLASNLAALRALAGEGIQKGHMKLHRRKHDAALAAGAGPDEVSHVPAR
jgi:hydroxymethylglutaryl-CoA reductase